jgi:hypothetical protein
VANPVYIWVRATLDWEREEAVRPTFRPRVDLWNATFNLSFHAFRHRVREIARLNHSRVEGTVCAGWEEIPGGALVLPVDDDDWFSPDTARVLERELDPRAVGYYWRSTWIEVPRTLGHRLYLIQRRLLPWTPPKWICTTNNYAMIKSEGAKALLEDHCEASRWVEGQIEGPGRAAVKRIDRRLSVANRTLGSQTSLRYNDPSMSRSRLIRRFRRYRRLYDRATPPELDWCRPYLEMMAALMEELEIGERR